MGQTEHFTLADYVRILNTYLGEGRINTVLVNTKVPDPGLLKRYEAQEGKGTLIMQNGLSKDASYRIVEADLLADEAPHISTADKIAKSRSLIRHDSDKLADVIMKCLK